jgi:hypothetical protein
MIEAVTCIINHNSVKVKHIFLARYPTFSHAPSLRASLPAKPRCTDLRAKQSPRFGQIAVEWGRYAALLAHDDADEVFYLEPATA